MGATHVQAWLRVPGAQLAAVVSADEQKLSGDLTGIRGNLGEGGARFDFSQISRYREWDACLRDPAVDAVDICVPTDLHQSYATAALRAGKHVLVEKPLALDGASADRMIEEARRAGRTLMCAQVLRFFPVYRVPLPGPAQSARFTRQCGEPEWSGWLRDPARSGGGVFDLLIHDVDYSVRLFGAPQSVSAYGYTDLDHGIDWVVAEFQYEHTGPVVIEGGWYFPGSFPFRMQYRIITESGILEYDSAQTPPGEGAWEAELAYFTNCATANRQPELCPPEDSALAVRLTRAMLESRRREGETLACSKLD